ncbi:MAG: chemotaxis protein CheW, partial [Pseudomonadota bacterium]
MNALTSADFAASSALRVGVLEVGARKFGLDIKNLAEICVIQKVLPLLSGRPDVLGAIDLRGNIIPLLDPLALCQAGGYDGMPELAAIVQHEGRLIALGIDRALSISDFDGSDVQQLYKTDHNSTIPIRSGLLSEKTNINLLEPARIFAQPDMPSRSATHERAKDTALGGSRAFLTFEAGGAAFGLEAIQIYGTVPRQNIEVSTMTGGDCLGEISYLNRRVPIMDATR